MADKLPTPCEALATLRALRTSACQGLGDSGEPTAEADSPALPGESVLPSTVSIAQDSVVRIAAQARGRGLTGIRLTQSIPVGLNPEQCLNADPNRCAITFLPTAAGSLVAPDSAPLAIQKGHSLTDGKLTTFREEDYGALIWQAWFGWQFGVLGVFIWEEYYINGLLPEIPSPGGFYNG